MIEQAGIRRLLSGEEHGLRATCLRSGLWLLQWPYRGLVYARNWAYNCSAFKVSRVSVPVVSVGNLTVGGVGKTPLVVWLARWFRQRAVRVSVVSRGYGAEEGGRNDEAMELEVRLPDVPHAQHPSRLIAARIAIEEFETQLILLDDAFQHRRLFRDLDIVVVDALCPFGYGHTLPRGLLREPISALRRASLVVLSRADLVDEATRESIWDRICRSCPHAERIEGVHRPTELVSAHGQVIPVQSLAGRRVAAFSGIGNPVGFRRTLESCGAQIVGWREFPDHYRYQRSDIDNLTNWVQRLSAVEIVICTSKDLVKLDANELGDCPLWSLVVNFEISLGEELLTQKLAALSVM